MVLVSFTKEEIQRIITYRGSNSTNKTKPWALQQSIGTNSTHSAIAKIIKTFCHSNGTPKKPAAACSWTWGGKRPAAAGQPIPAEDDDESEEEEGSQEEGEDSEPSWPSWDDDEDEEEEASSKKKKHLDSKRINLFASLLQSGNVISFLGLLLLRRAGRKRRLGQRAELR